MLFSVAASAQEEAPKIEVFGGYSYLHLSDQGVSDNLNGGSASVSYNLRDWLGKDWLGIVGDFGVYHGGPSSINGRITSYLVGPKVAFRQMGKVTPFAQFLLGGARLSSGSFSENDFAITLGGGADYRLTERWGVRLIQAEYMLTKFTDGGNNRQNDARISAGVVVRF
jgi:opacity protein-like surface antigen